MFWGQYRYDPTGAEKVEIVQAGRVPGTRAKRSMEKNLQVGKWVIPNSIGNELGIVLAEGKEDSYF